MIHVLIALLHETGVLTKRGVRIMLRHGLACAVALWGLLLVQQELPIVPVWALLSLYILFLIPHTLMLVSLMRGMLFQYMQEHFSATLKWRPHHTNFLYDSLYFLGIYALILFCAEGIILTMDTHKEIGAFITEIKEREGDGFVQQLSMRESFALLMHSGVLVVLGITGFLFLALMLIWARNIVLMPATALGFRIRSDEARVIMQGHVLPVAVITMLANSAIAGLSVGLYKLLLQSVPVEYATATSVAFAYWLAIYLNAAFSSAAFSLFTEGLQLRSDFKGF